MIAEAIGRGLGLPVTSVAPDDAVGHFGFIGSFFAMNMAASSEQTRKLLGWEPTGPTLIEDIEAGAYFRRSLARMEIPAKPPTARARRSGSPATSSSTPSCA